MPKCPHRPEGVKPVGRLQSIVNFGTISAVIEPDYDDNCISVATTVRGQTTKACFQSSAEARNFIAQCAENDIGENAISLRANSQGDVFLTQSELCRRVGLSRQRISAMVAAGRFKKNERGHINYSAFIRSIRLSRVN